MFTEDQNWLFRERERTRLRVPSFDFLLTIEEKTVTQTCTFTFTEDQKQALAVSANNTEQIKKVNAKANMMISCFIALLLSPFLLL